MRRILWCIISLCLILLSLALLLRFRDDADPLPAPLENVVSHVERLLSLSPEHAVDGFKQDEEEEVQKEEGEEEDAKEADVYEANPRYTIEQDPEQGEVLRSEIQKGDTAGKILGDWMDANELAELLAAAKPVYALTKVRFGQPFAVVRDPQTKAFRCFKYEINQEKYLIVEKKDDRFVARLEEIDYQTSLAVIKGEIKSTLSGAVTEQGENVALAIALANVFASEINFISDLREGDAFEVLVEKRFRHDAFEGYGRVLGAKFTNQSKQHTAYLFHNERGRETYYNAEGDNLHRELLKAPLSFLRVTSRYSMARRHPVFGNTRPHQGIDYGAPPEPHYGRGRGIITNIGRAGGYGKQVIIRHDNGAGVALRAYRLPQLLPKNMKNGNASGRANHRLRGCDRHGDRPPSRFPYPEARAVRQSGQADHSPRSGAGKTTHGGLQTGRPCRGRLSDGQGYGQLRSRYMVQG